MDGLLPLAEVNPPVMVMIMSADTGAAIGSFNAFSPAVSPGGRFIALVKFYPPHGATELKITTCYTT